jgi:sugar lactone lactonase YvrE
MFSPPAQVGGLFFLALQLKGWGLFRPSLNQPKGFMTWQTVVSTPDQLGESPFWHPTEGRLYWLDIPGRQLHRLHIASGTQQSWSMPSEPGCMAPAESGGLVVALRSGVYRARTWGGALDCIVAAPYDTASMRFNDGKADTEGRFWSGTLDETRTAANAQLWSLDGRGGAPQLEAKAGGATTGNGLAWSPDARTLYWADTPTHTIRAWDWNAQSNTLARPRVFAHWPGKPAGWQAGMDNNGGYGGRPDGAAVDAQGNYWVAMFEGGRILKLSPMGEMLAEWSLPAQCPTMPCFGGDDLRTLFVTTARQNRPVAELHAFPDSGSVFAMRVDVPGLPVNFYRG